MFIYIYFVSQTCPFTAVCTTQPNLNLSPAKASHAELGQNARAVMLRDAVARICARKCHCALFLFILTKINGKY